MNNEKNNLNDLIEQTITLSNDIKELKQDLLTLKDLHEKYHNANHCSLISSLTIELIKKEGDLRRMKAFITFHYVSITQEEEEVTSSYENELMPDNSHYEGDWAPYRSNNRY